MSTFALEGSDAAGASGRLTLVRYADLALLALALPVFLLAGWPLLGYAALAAAWLAQHALLVYGGRRSTEEALAGNRRAALGFFAIATLGRVWLVTATVLAVGLIGDREDGLAAALLAAVLVTVHLGGKVVGRLVDPEQGRRR
ncbi:MAG TPA: hypothetical protein VK919_10385 [Solirubrobacterales bacterium]|nr:hypothetical protein [Solirubrobacterales bacterium]